MTQKTRTKRYAIRLATGIRDRSNHLPTVAPDIMDAIRILAADEGVSQTHILESALIDYFGLTVPYKTNGHKR